MSIVRIRLRKKIIPKIQQWCAALDVSSTEFVHEALTYYIRSLGGIPTLGNVVQLPVPKEDSTTDDSLEVSMDDECTDDYSGGIAL